jgi:hypothetical protein
MVYNAMAWDKSPMERVDLEERKDSRIHEWFLHHLELGEVKKNKQRRLKLCGQWGSLGGENQEESRVHEDECRDGLEVA